MNRSALQPSFWRSGIAGVRSDVKGHGYAMACRVTVRTMRGYKGSGSR